MPKPNPPASEPEAVDPFAQAMAAAEKMKHPGLRLTLPGAPLTPAFIPGVAGVYRPDTPALLCVLRDGKPVTHPEGGPWLAWAGAELPDGYAYGEPHTPSMLNAVPVGGPGEIPLEAAVRASLDDGVHVEIVDIPKGDVEACRERAAADVREAREGIRDARVAHGALKPEQRAIEAEHIIEAHDAVNGDANA